MPGKGTSNVARETPKEAKKKARQKAALRGLAGGLDQLGIRQPMRKMIRGDNALRKAAAGDPNRLARELLRLGVKAHGPFEMPRLPERKKKKKKDVPPRFQLIIPPVH